MSSIEISDEHAISKRVVHLIDEGPAIWMYLTSPGGMEIASDCWVQNCIPAPASIEAFRESASAPPATIEYVKSEDPGAIPRDISFEWAANGEAVAVRFGGVTMAFIDSANKFGYSRNLTKRGPFGSPLDNQRFEFLFGHPIGHPI